MGSTDNTIPDEHIRKIAENAARGGMALLVGHENYLRVPDECEIKQEADENRRLELQALRDCGGSMEKWMLHIYDELLCQRNGANNRQNSFDEYFYRKKHKAVRSDLRKYFDGDTEDDDEIAEMHLYRLGTDALNPQLKKLIDSRLFRVVLTTNYDPLLEQYMIETWSTPDPLTEKSEDVRICNIKAADQSRDFPGLNSRTHRLASDSSNSDFNTDMPPTLYYLFGKATKEYKQIKEQEPYALLEEDRLKIIKQWINTPPKKFSEYLKTRNILSVGCRFDDWLFRFFWFGVLERDNPLPAEGNVLAISFDSHADAKLLQFLKWQEFKTYNDTDRLLECLNHAICRAKDEYFREKRRKGGVFISYKSINRGYARDMFCRLADKKIDVWYDEHDLINDAPYQKRIKEAIQNASVFLALISKEQSADTDLPDRILDVLPANPGDIDENQANFRFYRDFEWKLAQEIGSKNNDFMIVRLALPNFNPVENRFSDTVRETYKEMVGANTIECYSAATLLQIINNIKSHLGITD